jgi:hypothetical protein
MVVADVLYLNSELVSQIQRRIVADWAPGVVEVVVGATHTHSGPSLRGPDDGPGRAVLEAAHRAGVAALADLRPARLWAGSTRVPGLGVNRRDGRAPALAAHFWIASSPSDPTEAIAALVEFSCHATVLEHDNLLYSPDYPGHCREILGQLLGAPVTFLQGCAGDVNPVFTSHSPAAARQAGLILATAVGGRAARGLRDAAGASYVNLTWNGVFPGPEPAPLAELPPGPIRRRQARVKAQAAERLPPERATEALARARADWRQGASDLPPGVEPSVPQRRLAAVLGQAWAAELRCRPAAGPSMLDPHEGEVELVADLIELGPAGALCALPGEAFVATASRLRGHPAAPPHLLVGAYAGQAFGYLPPLEEYAELGYEVGAAHLAPGSIERLEEALVALYPANRPLEESVGGAEAGDAEVGVGGPLEGAGGGAEGGR